MSAETNTRRALIAGLIVLVAAAAFWLLVLSPKRKEASELSTRAEAQQQVLSEAQAKATEASAAHKAFPKDYRKMVLLGKAVPEGDETASLIVQIQTIANHSKVAFSELTLEGGGEGEGVEAPSTAEETGPTSTPVPVPPTEAEASLLPLGASVGAANLGVMPYHLKLIGSFDHLADFFHDVERLIKTRDKHLKVEGRLLTLNGFSLTPAGTFHKSEILVAEVDLDTYLAPPAAEGGEAGVEEAGLLEGEAPVPASETGTTTATPSSYASGEAR